MAPATSLYTPPRETLFTRAADLPTPALVYDLPGIHAGVRRIRADVARIPNAGLNIALKACHTPDVLRELATLGLGCDVASPGELDLARACGFSEVSATGPVFHGAALDRLDAAGVTLDVDSLDQLAAFGRARPGADVGLRVRVSLPAALQSHATFAADSRFGVRPEDAELPGVLARHRLRVTRLHVHTGQMTPDSLCYKIRYLLTVAEHFPDVHTIDLGGGFFHLYANPHAAARAFARAGELVREWTARTGRSPALRFEPGGAVLTPYGYLVTRVLAVEGHHPAFGTRVVTVDASAWNLAPWHNRPEVLAVDARPAGDPALVAGCTLYENDFFGATAASPRNPVPVPECRAGERLVLTATGAYTMTNARWFNRVPPPQEYLFDGERMVPTTPPVRTPAGAVGTPG